MEPTPSLRILERVVEEPPDEPERPVTEYQPMQEVTRTIALGDGWSPDLAARLEQLFDALAPEWHTRGGDVRLAPLRDALARGDVPTGGTCVEIGSGTGLQTALLAAHFDRVVSVDFAAEMLARAPAGLSALVRADASRLPLRDHSVQVVACINAFLFPAEYDRVLGAGGLLVFISTVGARTPIYLPPEDVLAALPGRWEATSSEAASGIWTAARRAAS